MSPLGPYPWPVLVACRCLQKETQTQDSQLSSFYEQGKDCRIQDSGPKAKRSRLRQGGLRPQAKGPNWRSEKRTRSVPRMAYYSSRIIEELALATSRESRLEMRKRAAGVAGDPGAPSQFEGRPAAAAETLAGLKRKNSCQLETTANEANQNTFHLTSTTK